MADICGRPAAWTVLHKKIRHPFCRSHINTDAARQQGFKVLRAKKGEKCGQSMNIERALLAYGDTLIETQDSKKAMEKAKEEWSEQPE